MKSKACLASVLFILFFCTLTLFINHQAFAQKVQLKTGPPDMSGDPEYILINGNPNNISVGNARYLGNLDFRKNPWSKKFPKADYFGRVGFRKQSQLPGGGQRFLFTFLIQDGCHGCTPLGSANVAYDFDGSGRFSGAKILGFGKKTDYQ